MTNSSEHGFNIVIYSCMHTNPMENDMIHNDNAARLILQKGKCLIFRQNLIRS